MNKIKNFKINFVFSRTSLKTLVVVAIMISSFAKAEKEVLFEGYSKVIINKQHIGYLISRYEFDPSSKNFFATVFVKTGALGENVTESIKAVSDSAMSPISYEYTTLVIDGKKTITKKIDAVFRVKKNKSKTKNANSKTKNGIKNSTNEIKTLYATVTQDGKMSKIETDLPEGSFMSYFLVYLMLKSKSGLQTGSKYEYKAIAEEKANIIKGKAKVATMEDFKGFKAYKIDNEFDNQKFTSYVTDRGEVLGVINPASGVETELVAKPNEAVGEFLFPTATLKTLFGEVPLGTSNIVSKTLKQESLKSVTEPPGSKQFGTSAGSGIFSKPSSSSTVEVEKIEKPMPKTTDSKEIIEKK